MERTGKRSRCRATGPSAWGRLVVAVWLAVAAAPALGADAWTSARQRVGSVTARSYSDDGSTLEETGNGLLWTDGARTYTLGDLHTVMAGKEDASERVADEIVVSVGQRSSRARLVWPLAGARDVRGVDISILELEDAVGAAPFGSASFEGRPQDLPREIYLAAPGHRHGVVSMRAPAVAYGSEWFIYKELSHGDSGGLIFALQDGDVVLYGFVSAVGSLPGESARGTLVYGRHAMRIVVDQFLRARARRAATLPVEAGRARPSIPGGASPSR